MRSWLQTTRRHDLNSSINLHLHLIKNIGVKLVLIEFKLQFLKAFLANIFQYLLINRVSLQIFLFDNLFVINFEVIHIIFYESLNLERVFGVILMHFKNFNLALFFP